MNSHPKGRTAKRYYVIPSNSSTSGDAELWERVGNNRARLFIETSSGVARRIAKLLNLEDAVSTQRTEARP